MSGPQFKLRLKAQMPRPRNAVPTEVLFVRLPAEVKALLDLHLTSQSQGKVPYAAYQKFMAGLITDFFEQGSLDLAAYYTGFVPGSVIRGPKSTIMSLRERLESIRV